MAGNLRAGFGKAEITAFEPGMCLSGWGQLDNVARDVAAPLYARALVVERAQTGNRLAYVCADLGYISEYLRQTVLALMSERGIALGEHELMLTATHTHSGPSGYSRYLFYRVIGPGFSPRIAQALALGIVQAIEAAIASLTPARLRLTRASVPLVEAVAFNRSLAAYNLNADVEPLSQVRSDEALDREMVLLRVDERDGPPMGVLTWFAVHGTSIHRGNQSIHPDNKGVAAQRFEAMAVSRFGARERPFVAIFAQEAAGDVTPNFRWSPRRKLLIGRYDDDFESADFAGSIQARHAWTLFLEAETRGEELDGLVRGQLSYHDFANITLDPEFANGQEGRTTSPACLGLAFAYGTLEGPGPLFPARRMNAPLSRLTARRRRRREQDWRTGHGPKPRFFDLGHGASGRILSVLSTRPCGFGLIPDRRVAYYQGALSRELGTSPWVPQILPLQIFRIGSLAIVGLPVEPTTVSGRRLRGAAMSVLGSKGVRRVVINGYANAYASYVTTFEEYQLQNYEGASTLFGQWTLGAWCTKVRELSRSIGSEERTQSNHARPLGEQERSLPQLTKRPNRMPLHSRVQEFYENLSAHRELSLAGLETLFASDIRFRDPFRDTVGIEPFRELFVRMFKQYRLVEFTDFVAEGDETAFTLRYDMHLRMAMGPTFVTPMASVFRARDGKVCELHDYYDFPSGLVSPIPLLATAYKRLINRLFL
ncbi:MAG TPA: neutral/alkaline non-lysosomal ceramidase N-terminal domain-containing protein [Polyangiaceae bacterium]|nr:neutral/alkaline non-lysosomal ceramidase N-terminal domain-containing protein [Polyangiaceae bacterium]